MNIPHQLQAFIFLFLNLIAHIVAISFCSTAIFLHSPTHPKMDDKTSLFLVTTFCGAMPA